MSSTLTLELFPVSKSLTSCLFRRFYTTVNHVTNVYNSKDWSINKVHIEMLY